MTLTCLSRGELWKADFIQPVEFQKGFWAGGTFLLQKERVEIRTLEVSSRKSSSLQTVSIRTSPHTLRGAIRVYSGEELEVKAESSSIVRQGSEQEIKVGLSDDDDTSS